MPQTIEGNVTVHLVIYLLPCGLYLRKKLTVVRCNANIYQESSCAIMVLYKISRLLGCTGVLNIR